MSSKNQTPSSYNFKEREQYWQKFWEDNGIYIFNENSQKSLFNIDTPPPTISGKLHLGHVFSYTHAEVIVRYNRMAGKNVFYPLGLDNNGLPTELLIEKENNADPRELGAEEFSRLVRSELPKYQQMYINLFKSLGFSYDYDLLYKTNSQTVEKLVQNTFLDFQKRDLVYKAQKPALYCWQCQTSVAQAEVEDKLLPGTFYDLKFTLETGEDLVIATTRPELLPAIVAVFVNPQDSRYKNIVGKKVTTPLGKTVKIVAAPEVEMDKGSGAVMICSYGDETDLALIEEYKLPEEIVFNREGRFILQANEVSREVASSEGSRFESTFARTINGLTIPQAKQKIVEYLEENGFILNKTPLTHDVGVHERCGTPIEIIPTTQWFVKILPFKEQILEAGKKINWYPGYMRKRFEDWVVNLKWDWCISRERYYGIKIPGEENLYFDTWFTSSQTPDILNQPWPMSLRPQAHDIIRTWAFYTIVMGVLKHNGKIPWQQIMISGHILAKKGIKISKRTGGGAYAPEELIKEHGADSVRYAMCSASLGKDAFFEETELANAKKLILKLTNAARFILMHTGSYPSSESGKSAESRGQTKYALDQWILSRSQKTAEFMSKEFEQYEYTKARACFETFFWDDFCDNYLELVKYRLYGEESEQKESAKHALSATFLNILKMNAPFMPHVTEDLYQNMYKQVENTLLQSIHITNWPTQELTVSTQLQNGAELLLELVSLMRKAKTEAGISLGREVNSITVNLPKDQHQLLEPFLEDLRHVSRASKMRLKPSSNTIVTLS